MDGGHDHRRAGGNGGAGPDHLGAEHVGVDEVDLVVAQPAGELADGELVIGRVDDVDRDTQRPQPLDGRAGGQREGAHVVSATIQSQQEPGVALLGAAVPAGRQQLEDARTRMAP